jgi:hypothetical protein
MKKILLLLWGVSAFGVFAMAQTDGAVYPLNVDFENNPQGFSDWATSTAYSCVANPKPDAVNASAKVARYIVGNSPQGWWGFGSAIGGAIQWSPSGDTLSFKVWCAKTIRVVVHIENLEDYTIYSKQDTLNYTTPGRWQILKAIWAGADTFTHDNALKTGKMGLGTKLTIYPEAGGGNPGDIIYLDDFTGLNYKYTDVLVTAVLNDVHGYLTEVPKVKFGADANPVSMTVDMISNSYTISKKVKVYTPADNVNTQFTIYFLNNNNNVINNNCNLSPNGGNLPITVNCIYYDFIDDHGTDTINKISTPPTIDGVVTAADGWDAQPFHSITHNMGAINPNFSSKFKMSWDDDNLYILNITDDSHLNSSNATSWQNDCVELYFHMGSTENPDGSYQDGDWQLRLQWNHSTLDG